MVSFRKKSNIFFFTATNLNWLRILDNNDHKQIILNSLKFLHEENRATIFAFVIMPNHIHLILRIEDGHKKHEIQRDFLKYTSQQIKFNLIKIDSPLLDDILVNDKDR
ncbi:MAG: transposase, partial [Burkholderiales bacterium]|nr:transposase [Burkholderiales bacterium]